MDIINVSIAVLVIVAVLFKLGGVVYFIRSVANPKQQQQHKRDDYDRGFDAYQHGGPVPPGESEQFVQGYADAALQRARK